MDKIRWGVLGAALIARTRTLPAMAVAPSVELTALASRSLAKATALCAELGVKRAYGSYEELLADPDIDAVYLPLPNNLHCEWAARAMKAGKHVLCEKPLCLTLTGSTGWLRLDYPLAHALATRCHIFVGDDTSIGGFETSTLTFDPVNQYTLQAERFSRHVLGDQVRTRPIEGPADTLRTINALFESANSGHWEPLAAGDAADTAIGVDAIEHGDRVVAARDIDTTQGLHVLAGTEGTVAEDRGSKLVVFFEEDPKLTSVAEEDVHKLPE